jgi:formate hydrogenlyase subunit 6/NADH:ubiquinone oxidoreductase subunit I
LRQVLEKYSSPLTLKYPSNTEPDKKYSQIPDGLRGFIERSEEKCIGCKACTNVCSGKATTFMDNIEAAKRTISVFHFRCTFCQHCQIECPTEAITLTKRFEYFSTTRDDPKNYELTTLDLLRCANCGKPFFPKKYVDKAFDLLTQKINPLTRDTVIADFKKVEQYCPDCRRAFAVKFDTHTKKHVWLE